MSVRTLLALLGWAAFGCSPSVVAPAGSDVRSVSVESRREAVIRSFRAGDTKGTAIALRQLLDGRDAMTFVFDDHPVIALHADWRHTFPTYDAFKPLDPDAAHRFLDHFSVRTGHAPCHGWVARFPQELFRFSDEPRIVGPGVHAEGTLAGHAAVTRSRDGELKVEDAGPDLAFRKGDRTLKIDKGFLARQASHPPLFLDAVEVLFQGDDVFLIRYGQLADMTCDLYCFDRRSGALRWRGDVWGPPPGAGSGPGGGPQFLEIVADKDVVLVFGIGMRCRFAEAFHRVTGESLWRFSTDLWGFDSKTELSK